MRRYLVEGRRQQETVEWLRPSRPGFLSPAVVFVLALFLAWSSVPDQLWQLEASEPGFSYEHRRTLAPFSIHILEISPDQAAIRLVRARDQGLGRETVSSIARRKNAFAALNAGFFRIGSEYDGLPSGIVKIRDQWFSSSSLPRAAIGWSSDGRTVLVDRVTVEWKLKLGSGEVSVDSLNRPRRRAGTVLFTSSFGRSTLTAGGGVEWILDGGRFRSAGSEGNSPIPQGGAVFSIGPDAEVDPRAARPGDPVEIQHHFVPIDGTSDDHDWRQMDFVVGGTPLLVRGGEVIRDFEAERVLDGFIRDRHPRTAVGVRPEGTWVFVVVDGRQPTHSIGMSIAELADLMKSLGCRDALNLDGGGSTTFYLYGQVLNSPSDLTGERPVSDAIVLLRR